MLHAAASSPGKILLYGIWTGFALILLTPFVVTPQTIFPYVVGKALYSRVIIEIVFGFWTLLAFLRPAFRPPRSRLLILFAIILGVTTLAAFYGVSVQRSFWSSYERMQGVVDLIHWFLFTVVLVSAVRTVRDWRILLNFNLGFSLTMALLAVGQKYYFSDAPFLIWDLQRVGTTLGNPIYLGMYVMVNIVVALGFLAQSFIPVATPAASPPSESMGERRRKRNRMSPPAVTLARLRLQIRRIFWGSVVLIDLWALGLTASRGPLAGLVTAVGFLAVLSIVLGNTRIARVATVGLTSLLGAGFLLTLLLSFRPSLFPPDTVFSSLFSNRSSGVWERLAGWQVGLKGFADKPMLGWGPENYIVISGRYAAGLSGHMPLFDNAHNKLVEELTTKGLFGLLSYLSLWTFMFCVVARAARGMDFRERILTLFVGAALAGTFRTEPVCTLLLHRFSPVYSAARFRRQPRKSTSAGRPALGATSTHLRALRPHGPLSAQRGSCSHSSRNDRSGRGESPGKPRDILGGQRYHQNGRRRRSKLPRSTQRCFSTGNRL